MIGPPSQSAYPLTRPSESGSELPGVYIYINSKVCSLVYNDESKERRIY